MDAKIIIYLLLAAGLIGGTYGIFYSDDLDGAERELAVVQSQVKSTGDLIETRKVRLAARHEAAALIAQAEVLTKEQEAIRKEIADLHQQETVALDATLNAVKKVREKAVGETAPELVLNTGKTLKQTRIQTVEEDVIVVTHSEGVAKIPGQDLPKELRDKFVFGINGKKPEPTDAAPTETAAVDPSPPKTTVAVRPVAPARVVKGNIRIEGDPELWNEVTRRSLGRVFVPGKGWLVVGTKGPIPPMKDYP
jgi:hypothetical protein